MSSSSSALSWAQTLVEVEETAIIEQFQQLVEERDTFKAMTLQYKEAFEIQRNQLQECQDLLTATQAELKNERMLTQRRSCKFGEANVFEPHKWLFDTDWVSSSSTRAHFGDIERLFSKREHAKALSGIDDLLRRPLEAEARLEALLLKSSVLRALGTEYLYDALAQCSEAVELCDRHILLQSLRPKANFYKGLCLYRLKWYPQARLAFAGVGASEFFHERAAEFLIACHEEQQELATAQAAEHRSAFDERRTFSEGHLRKLIEKETEVSTLSSVDLQAPKAVLEHLKQPTYSLTGLQIYFLRVQCEKHFH